MRLLVVSMVCSLFLHATHGAFELTEDTFDSTMFGGKNVFVKFFAPWCGHCKGMKPAWDKLSDEYLESTSVVVADVDCTAHQSVCTKHGVSGYPTLKFWKDGSKEAETFQGGRDFDALKKFVVDNLERECQVSDLSTCTEKEAGYHTKMSVKTSEDQTKELARLKGMSSGSMKPDLKRWLFQRINLLTQMTQA